MLVVGGLFTAGAALVLNIVGVALPYWYYYAEVEKGAKISMYFGLWKLCIKAQGLGKEQTGCRNFDAFALKIVLPEELKVVRGVELSAIVLLVAVIIACVKIITKKDDRYLKVSAAILCFAGLLSLVGAVVFVTSSEMKNLIIIQGIAIPFKPHAGFALCIVSGILGLAAAVMFLAENGGENRTQPNDTQQLPVNNGLHHSAQQQSTIQMF